MTLRLSSTSGSVLIPRSDLLNEYLGIQVSHTVGSR